MCLCNCCKDLDEAAKVIQSVNDLVSDYLATNRECGSYDEYDNYDCRYDDYEYDDYDCKYDDDKYDDYDCGCGRKVESKHDNCGCKPESKHDNCGCGRKVKPKHDNCGCGRKVEPKHDNCGCKPESKHGDCGCGRRPEPRHDNCGCGCCHKPVHNDCGCTVKYSYWGRKGCNVFEQDCGNLLPRDWSCLSKKRCRCYRCCC